MKNRCNIWIKGNGIIPLTRKEVWEDIEGLWEVFQNNKFHPEEFGYEVMKLVWHKTQDYDYFGTTILYYVHIFF